MRTITKHLTYTKVAASMCVFLLLGGAAWAAARTSPATIHACYAKRGGALRMAARCRRGEKPLSWSQTGPAGPAGPGGAAGAPGQAGAAGQAGVQGAVGPSDVYAGGRASAKLTGAEYRSFGQLHLPAGSYLVEASATFFDETVPNTMVCFIAPSPTLIGELDHSDSSALPGNQAMAMMTGTVTVAGEQTEELLCKLSSPGESSIDDAHILAISTGALHGSLPVD